MKGGTRKTFLFKALEPLKTKCDFESKRYSLLLCVIFLLITVFNGHSPPPPPPFDLHWFVFAWIQSEFAKKKWPPDCILFCCALEKKIFLSIHTHTPQERATWFSLNTPLHPIPFFRIKKNTEKIAQRTRGKKNNTCLFKTLTDFILLRFLKSKLPRGRKEKKKPSLQVLKINRATLFHFFLNTRASLVFLNKKNIFRRVRFAIVV